MSPNSGAIAASAGPRYYRASDRVGTGLFVWLPLVGGLGAMGLGLLYAFFAGLFREVEAPFCAFISMVVFAGALTGLGWWVCHLGEVRKRRLRLPILLIVGAMGLYASWHYYLQMLAGSPFHFWPATHLSPIRLFHGMRELAGDRGIMSWFKWFFEAATIFGFLIYFAGELEADPPFCEQCGQWTKETLRLKFGDKFEWSAAEAFKRGEFETLAELGEWSRTLDRYVRVRVVCCPCSASRYASMDSVKIDRGKKWGVRQHTYTPGHSKFYLDPGSPDTEDASPLVENMEIDAAGEAKLAAIRPGDCKPVAAGVSKRKARRKKVSKGTPPDA